MLALVVAMAAGVGAVCRVLVERVARRRSSSPSPIGIVLVNVSGSLVLGLLLGWHVHHGLSDHVTVVLGTGWCGGFTTLSTWAWQTLELWLAGESRRALLNAGVSFGVGLAAAAAGLAIALVG